MGDLDALVAESKTKISQLIAKPKMSEKLLSKPPFRFLQDTISAIINATGFGEGLYSAEEMEGQITEKHAKIAYLEKIFLLVGICVGHQLSVQALKVIQGLEAEHTNQFLIDLADCAADATIDSVTAVQRALSNEQPGSFPPPRKSSGGIPPSIAESKVSEPDKSGAKGSSDDRKSFPSMEGSKETEAKLPIEMEQAVVPERGKSRGGTRGGKPQQATADTGLSGFADSLAPRLDAEIEKCDGSEAVTQALLGELITRPKLSEKHLSKPPFRFLFDIVMEVIKATGFGRGLYSEAESNSENVTSREQKIEFLEKIIKLVGIQLNTLVEAKPARIIAGLDVQNTNNFLQLLAVAAKHLPDSSAAVNTILDGGSVTAPAPVSAPPSRAHVESPPREAAQSRVEVEPAPMKRQSAPAPADAKEQASVQNRDFIPDDKQVGQDNTNDLGGDGGGEEKRSTRPSTARRRPPKVKEGATELQAKDTVVSTVKKATGIIVDGADDDEVEEVIGGDDTGSRLADELRADSKGGDDVEVSNPQSKLVQNIMSRQVEQEAVSGKGKDSKPGASPIETIDESKQDNSGGGIRLNRLRKPGSDKKGKDSSPQVATSFAEGDLEKMRQAIQSLVQQTGPLGTCLDFIQEDISLMSGELHKWEEECRRYEADYDEARKKTKEKLIPLRNELDELNDQIAEQISLISATKTSNLRLEEKIQSTLKMIATS